MSSEALATAPSPGRPSSGLHYIVGKIDGKMDQLLVMWTEQREEFTGIKARVAKLESWQSRIMGGGAALTLLVTATEIIRYVATTK